MGEIAEAMLDGTFCMHCGETLLHGPEDVANGFPTSCGCDGGDHALGIESDADDLDGRTCDICGKLFSTEDGVLDHMNAKHKGWDTDGDIKMLVEIIYELYPLAEERVGQKGYCGTEPDFLQIQSRLMHVMSMNSHLFV